MALSIYQASAGSGKTYTIVREYLLLLLEASPDSLEGRLRSILAITFTNKAAAEMKERVLLALRRLASGEKDPYPEFWEKYSDVQKRAQGILTFILHHYSDFSITTIDSFIQRLSKSVAFELELPLHFQVLLDGRQLFEEVVDYLLTMFEKDDVVTKLLSSYVDSALVTKKSLVFSYTFQSAAKEIYKEKNYFYLAKTLQEKGFRCGNEFFEGVIKNFAEISQKRRDIAKGVLDKMTECGIDKDHVANKGRGNVSYFEKISNNEDVDEYGSNIEKWTNKAMSANERNNIEMFYSNVVSPALQQIRLYDDHYINLGVVYYIYEAVQKNLHFLALMNVFQERLHEVMWMRQTVLIEEFVRRLYEKLSTSAVPYLYMRLGERYRYFFIDEFQDTSRLQWESLAGLVDEALSSGGKAYLVGDPKQAIYRWRNGDVTIMLRDVEKRFHLPKKCTLEQNYRSLENIVDFVNKLFTEVSKRFAPDNNQDAPYALFRDSYKDVAQKPMREAGGLAEVVFSIVEKGSPQEKEADDTNDNDEATVEKHTLRWCFDKVKSAQGSGYSFRDMAILVRKKKHASLIVEYLMKNKIDVISGDALFVARSEAVRLIVSSMTLLLQPGDRLALLSVLGLYAQIFMPEKDFHELVGGLFGNIPDNAPSGSAMDALKYWENREMFSAVIAMLEDRFRLFALSVYDLSEEIIRRFNLQQSSGHHVYLTKFLDVVHDFGIKGKGHRGVGDFLRQWEHISEECKIDPDESLDAVRVYTVHASKGLEFPVVIVPLIYGKAEYSKRMIAELEPFSGPHSYALPEHPDQKKWYWLYPNNKKSNYVPWLKKARKEEADLSLLDEVNVLYVAFTRARDALFVNFEIEEKKDKSKPFSDFSADTWEDVVNSIVQKASEEDGLKNNLSFLFLNIINKLGAKKENHGTKMVYTFGEPIPKSGKSDSTHKISHTIEKFPSHSWQKSLRVRRHDAEIHLLFHERQRESMEMGIILHELLAGVFSEGDIESVLRNYNDSLPGRLSEEVMVEMKGLLRGIWVLFVGNGWTTGFSVHNEETLLTPHGLIRPDKVFLAHDKHLAVVVDYKTGAQAREKDVESVTKAHEPQMRRYCESIHRMGYQRVDGYVLLVDSKKLLNVIKWGQI